MKTKNYLNGLELCPSGWVRSPYGSRTVDIAVVCRECLGKTSCLELNLVMDDHPDTAICSCNGCYKAAQYTILLEDLTPLQQVRRLKPCPS